MKNLMMAVVMLITCTTSMAQGIQEPEYIGQVHWCNQTAARWFW